MNYLRSLSQHPIFWVVLSLTLVTAPHLPRFPAWSIALLFVLFLWRLVCIKHHEWLPPKWLLATITILSTVGIFLHFGTLFGQTAGSVLLSVLLAIKLHESRLHRDYMLLIALSFFVIVTNFLFSQTILTVLFMLAIVVVLLISLISINQNNAPIRSKDKLKLSVKMLLQAIPLMLIMFVLFPRISGPLWKLPDEKKSAITGLSDTMSPGKISSLSKSNAVAFRVEFKNSTPMQHQLYWRALALWYFDGQTWERGKRNINPWPKIESLSDAIDYTITLEPHQKKWLFALDMPIKSSTQNADSIYYTNDFVLRKRNNITSLYQYTIQSALEYRIQPEISRWELSAGLKIPPNTNPRTIQLGKELAEQYQNSDDTIQHVLKMFNQQNFHYTLEPPLTPGFDPVDQFLFETRRGFCEHYASSFTLLMRAAGIPARVMIGYQGGTINPLNQVMTIRQSDAHAWSEIWIEDRGWVRIDPTAAIAPERIEQNLDAALDPDESRSFFMQMNNGLLKNMMFYWDAVDYQWNRWIVGYNSEFQQKFLESILKQRITLSDNLLLMVISFAAGILIISIFIIKPWNRKKIDPVVKYYNRFCRKLSQKGIHRKFYEGPMDFAARAAEQLPEQKNSIQLITRLYTKLRYEALHNEKQLDQLKQQVRKFS